MLSLQIVPSLLGVSKVKKNPIRLPKEVCFKSKLKGL